MNILYLVHDLADPAVARRIAMLRAGGATVSAMGFRRTATMPATDYPAIDLGQTHNGKFLQRIAAVIRQVLRLGRQRAAFAAADIVIARNLEMLALGVRGRSLCRDKPTLIYESLDIHRLLLDPGPVGKALRALEGWLAGWAAALLTSSPAFVSEYFQKLSQVRLPVRLVENRVFVTALPPAPSARLAGPPWKIGWFGAIRCAASLAILSDLVRESHGAVEVIIHGRPAYDQFTDFAGATTALPGLTYGGPYTQADLPALYGDVHFTWAIDRFEQGQNSAWLLPNRLYEGGLYGAVPLAEAAVEAGRWLAQHGIGVQLADPLLHSLAGFFQTLTADHYRTLAAAAAAVPRETWVYDRQDCRALVDCLAAA